ncbi:exonuclease V [Aplysia californica]|uniref:Exonuclease V n=1 Tax=Aplysia californica TaxID=6500 RepID=A0ABM0JVR4_APLCA|nr:exonuclease V [Aplysia californica]XP_035826769.1 exonuclease V [Aplysia californica]
MMATDGASCSFDSWSDADEEAMANLVFDDDQDSDRERRQFDLECDRVLKNKGGPLQQRRHKYLIVSDLGRQHWCEQQLLYSLDPDVYLMRALPGEVVNIEESKEVKEIKSKGSDIHLTRELEVHVPVEVKVVTKEDKWAVKLLNLQAAVVTFHTGGHIAREVPVFGAPFDLGIFVFGIIDELRYDPEHHKVDILELKTRNSQYPPKQSQQRKDQYQVSVYAQLFNELVLGKVSKEMVKKHLGLDLNKPLTADVMEHVRASNLGDKDRENTNLSSLLDTVLSQVQSLACISQASLEYVHQESKKQISLTDFDLDAESLEMSFSHHVKWWRGERGTEGVDIEDCWKCSFCLFSELCEWREYMANKTSKVSHNG